MRVNKFHHGYLALSGLGLGGHELQELSQQGVLRKEQGHGKTVFKIRFRSDGRQRVKRVPPNQVEAVSAELKKLQAGTRLGRELKRDMQIARSCLKTTKIALEPYVEKFGHHFHGYAIRRYRQEVTSSPKTLIGGE
jgi:hypothetical protein